MISDEQLSQRYVGDFDIFNEDIPLTQEELANLHPYYYDFYPSAEIYKKLIIRMTQIREQQEDFQLWLGFEQVAIRDGLSIWAPTENIMPGT